MVAVVVAVTRGHRHAEDGDRSREDDRGRMISITLRWEVCESERVPSVVG